jgi:hypothetical protein
MGLVYIPALTTRCVVILSAWLGRGQAEAVKHVKLTVPPKPPAVAFAYQRSPHRQAEQEAPDHAICLVRAGGWHLIISCCACYNQCVSAVAGTVVSVWILLHPCCVSKVYHLWARFWQKA